MKIKIVAFILIATTFFALCGCQKTPEKESVITKDFSEKIGTAMAESENTAEIVKIDVPKNVESTEIMSDKMTITYEASIDFPDCNKFPVIQVKPGQFTQDTVDKFIEYFVGDKKLFVWPAPETKADIEEQLIQAKRGNEIDGKFVPPAPDDPYIKELEEKLQNAPTEAKRQYVDSTLWTENNGSQNLSVGIEQNSSEDSILTVENPSADSYNSLFVYQRGGNLVDEKIAELNGFELRETSITQDEAIEIGNKVLKDLGISNMELASIYRCQMEKMGYIQGMSSSYESSGFEMIFMPVYDGIACIDTSENGTYTVVDNATDEYLPMYSAPWFQEMIMIYVDENGVQRFSWGGYTQSEKVIADNVQLMDFENIKERATQQIYYQNGGILDYVDHQTVNIKQISFGMSLINKKDEPGIGLMVPSWNIFYDISMDSGSDSYTDNGFIILNAVDGSVIDPLPQN